MVGLFCPLRQAFHREQQLAVLLRVRRPRFAASDSLNVRNFRIW